MALSYCSQESAPGAQPELRWTGSHCSQPALSSPFSIESGDLPPDGACKGRRVQDTDKSAATTALRHLPTMPSNLTAVGSWVIFSRGY